MIRIFRNGIQMHEIVFIGSFFRCVLLIVFACFFHIDMQVVFPILEMDCGHVLSFPERMRKEIGNSGNQWLNQRQRVAEEEQYGHLLFHTLIYGESGVGGFVSMYF